MIKSRRDPGWCFGNWLRNAQTLKTFWHVIIFRNQRNHEFTKLQEPEFHSIKCSKKDHINQKCTTATCNRCKRYDVITDMCRSGVSTSLLQTVDLKTFDWVAKQEVKSLEEIIVAEVEVESEPVTKPGALPLMTKLVNAIPLEFTPAEVPPLNFGDLTHSLLLLLMTYYIYESKSSPSVTKIYIITSRIPASGRMFCVV